MPQQETPLYYPFSRFLRDAFGCSVRKITVDAGLGCPNRDGAIGVAGCAFCVNESFSPAAGARGLSVREQVAQGIARARRSTKPPGAFMVYLQPFTNTHAPVETLRGVYDEAVDHEGVVALAIGTRPDCVPDDVLDLIQSYTPRLQVWIEYGVQSSHDHTLDRIGRGHGWDAVVDAVERTRGRGILICAHVILGLPGETREHMQQTADRLAALDIDGLKLHHLAIVEGSRLADEFRRGEVAALTCGEYVSLAADFLERTPSRVVIHRLVGDTRGGWLIAPKWAETKPQVLAAITAELKRRGSRQGMLACGR